MLVTSSDSNNTFTCNTVFSRHSTRKWYAKPFHKFLSNAQNDYLQWKRILVSFSLTRTSKVPCFIRSVTSKNERCRIPDMQTTRDCPLFHVTACLSFIWISQLSRVSLSGDFGKRLSHRCRLFMATAKTALFTSVRNTELVCAKHAM